MPNTTAKVNTRTASVEINVPITVAGSTRYIDVGVNLMSLPQGISKDETGIEQLVEVLTHAFTQPIVVQGPDSKTSPVDMPLSHAMVHAMTFKLKDS